jgi:hypothetical protein
MEAASQFPNYSRNSSVGIVTGWTAGAQFPVNAIDFSLLYRGRTGSEPTQPPIQRVSGARSPRVKQPRREADHCLPSSVQIQDSRAIRLLLHAYSRHSA